MYFAYMSNSCVFDVRPFSDCFRPLFGTPWRSAFLSAGVDPKWDPQTSMIPVTCRDKNKHALVVNLDHRTAQVGQTCACWPTCGAARAGLWGWQPVGCQPLEIPWGEPEGSAGDGDTASAGVGVNLYCCHHIRNLVVFLIK